MSIYAFLFAKPFEKKLQITYQFTSKYLSVHLLKIKIKSPA